MLLKRQIFMPNPAIDYSKIILEKDILKNDDDFVVIEQKKTANKKLPRILTFCISLALGFDWLLIYESVNSGFSLAPGDKYDGILFFIAILIFSYPIIWLVSLVIMINRSHKLGKDSRIGKNKLESILISKNNYWPYKYFVFTGQKINNKIMGRVNESDYTTYKEGAKLIVTYLEYSHTVLDIKEQQAT